MIFLNDTDVKSLIGNDIDIVVDAMYSGFSLMNKGDFSCGGKLHASHGMRLNYEKDNENAIYIAMPGYVGGDYQVAGVKWHGPMNKKLGRDKESNFSIILNDATSGKPIAIMNADYITMMRTAAVNILAAELLAPNGFKTLGIVGPGKINTLVTKGIISRMNCITDICIKGRSSKSVECFVDEIERFRPDIKINICDSVESVVKESDVVSLMTGFSFNDVSEMPNIREKWINPGEVFICGAFAYFSEKTLRGDVNRVCDLFEMYESYQNELGLPAYRSLSCLGNKFADMVVEGKLSKYDILNIGALVDKNIEINKKKPTFFSSGGIVIEDLILAKIVYDRAIKQSGYISLDWS